MRSMNGMENEHFMAVETFFLMKRKFLIIIESVAHEKFLFFVMDAFIEAEVKKDVFDGSSTGTIERHFFLPCLMNRL